MVFPNLKILHLLASEVKRQQDGPLSVADMASAYSYVEIWSGNYNIVRPNYFYGEDPKKIEVFISALAGLVKPGVRGYRTVPVTIGGRLTGSEPSNIRHEMFRLCEFLSESDYREENFEDVPEMFYQMFERIHPFIDGNGRVGFLIYNILNGTFYDLTVPPPYDPDYNFYR